MRFPSNIKALSVFGPPGTGKTTSAVHYAVSLIKDALVKPERIWALSLTRAAKYTLRKKFEAQGFREPEISTVHAVCYHALGRPHIVCSSELKEFFESVGLPFVEEAKDYNADDEYIVSDYSDKDGNRLLQAFNKLRLTWNPEKSWEEHMRRFYLSEGSNLGFSFKTFKMLFSEYERWLKGKGLYDFTMLLTEGYRRGVVNSGDLLILDEFQDIGNLHWAIIKRWIPNFKYVLCLGDDDQAIFEFAGSNPEIIINFPADKKVVLPKSYRLPQKIYALSQNVISYNRGRVSKEFQPREEKGVLGHIDHYDEALELLSGDSIYILCRNRFFVEQWAGVLENENIPYGFIGRYKPVKKLFKLINIIIKLRQGKNPVPPEEEDKVASEFKPLIRLITGKKVVRSKLFSEFKEGLFRRNFRTDGGKIAYLIYTKDIRDLFPNEDKTEIDKFLKRVSEYDNWVNPSIKLGTIHTAKGLEADRVILDTRITRRVLDSAEIDPECERRVLYTGITRAKKELYLFHMGGSYSYEHLGFV